MDQDTIKVLVQAIRSIAVLAVSADGIRKWEPEDLRIVRGPLVVYDRVAPGSFTTALPHGPRCSPETGKLILAELIGMYPKISVNSFQLMLSNCDVRLERLVKRLEAMRVKEGICSYCAFLTHLDFLMIQLGRTLKDYGYDTTLNDQILALNRFLRREMRRELRANALAMLRNTGRFMALSREGFLNRVAQAVRGLGVSRRQANQIVSIATDALRAKSLELKSQLRGMTANDLAAAASMLHGTFVHVLLSEVRKALRINVLVHAGYYSAVVVGGGALGWYFLRPHLPW